MAKMCYEQQAILCLSEDRNHSANLLQAKRKLVDEVEAAKSKLYIGCKIVKRANQPQMVLPRPWERLAENSRIIVLCHCDDVGIGLLMTDGDYHSEGLEGRELASAL